MLVFTYSLIVFVNLASGGLVLQQLPDAVMLRLNSFTRLCIALMPPPVIAEALGVPAHLCSQSSVASTIVARALSTMIETAQRQLEEVAVEAAKAAAALCKSHDGNLTSLILIQ
jgi:hypothetical protein